MVLLAGVFLSFDGAEANFDVAAAKKLVHPEMAAGGKRTLQDGGIHFQISYNFF